MAVPIIGTAAMQPALLILRGLADPRGRACRFGFLLTMVTAAVFGHGMMLFAGPLDLDNPSAVLIAAYALVVWVNAVPHKLRLHDLGLSGWWFWAAIPVTLIWSSLVFFAFFGVIEAFGGDVFVLLETGKPLYWVLFAVMLAPPMAGGLWLCLAKGEAEGNRYGMAPGRFGLSWPEAPERAMMPASVSGSALPAEAEAA